MSSFLFTPTRPPSPPPPAGILYDLTGSWSLSLFAPSIFFFLTGTAVYLVYGRAEQQVGSLCVCVSVCVCVCVCMWCGM